MAIDEASWFIVTLLYESVHEGKPKQVDENYDSLNKTYEESHILLKAMSSEEAYIQGEKFGLENEHNYENEYGEKVYWKLVKILDCYELLDDELKMGTEVYSRFIIAPKEVGTKEVINRYFPE